MENIASILNAIAWPIAAVAIVAMLKRPIGVLIPLLRKLKYKELEVEFENELKEIEIQTTEERKALPPTPQQESEQTDFQSQIQGLHPRAAILETWIEFEHTAYFIAQKFKLIDINRRVSFHELLKILQKNEIIEVHDIENINRLRKLRNSAVHERDIFISQSDAEQYTKVAMQVADILVARAFKRHDG